MMREIAGYQIVRRLGEGGMGSVYLAEAPDGRQVAIKVIRGELLDREEFRARFRSEVTRAQAVPPFSTAEVIEADPDHEPPYLVIEYVDGPSLAQVVRDSGPLKGAALHSLAVGVATALTAIHGAGVVHRDLKPANVLLPRGSVKVIDFGIAREMDASTVLTSANQVMGTVPYISPERLGGVSALTAAADIFAWGAVITYAATGRTPFGGDTPATTAIKIMTEPPNLDGLTGPLHDIVARTLAKDPDERPTARELLDDLLTGSAARSAPTAAKASPAVRAADPMTSADTGSTMDIDAPRPARRGRRVALVLASVVTVAAVAAAALFASGVLRLPREANADPLTSASPSPSVSSSPLGPHDGMRHVLSGIRDNWTGKPDPKNKADCVVDGDKLVLTLAESNYRCPSPLNQLGDLAVTVDVQISGGTCAAIWWHYKAKPGGYVLQICEERAYFADDNGLTHEILEFPGQGTKTTTEAVNYGVVQRGDEVYFYREGVEFGSWTVSVYPAGKVLFGILQHDSGSDSPAHVATFSNVELWGNPVPVSVPSGSASAPATPVA